MLEHTNKIVEKYMHKPYLIYILSKFTGFFPSEAHAMAGRRPAVARSERSERSVRKALLQKIELF